MKIDFLNNLSLRYKFVLIAFVGMMLLAVTLVTAGNITGNETEKRYINEQLDIQSTLWNRILSDQFASLKLGTSTFRREQLATRALAEQDMETLEERANTIYTRLLGGEILQHLQITNVSGEVVFRTDGIRDSGRSQMSVVSSTLSDKQPHQDIEIGKNGRLYAILAFPLFTSGNIVGSAVFISDLDRSVNAFAAGNELDAFIATNDGKLQQATNEELYGAITPNLPEPGERSVRLYAAQDRYYNVGIQPLLDADNNPVAHLVTMRDTTEAYLGERTTQWLTYTAVIVGSLLIAGLLLFYILHSFKPLEQLLDTVMKMREGNVTARMDVKQEDEIGKLGIAFNAMADELVDNLHKEMISKQELEGRIELLLDTVEKVGSGDLSAATMVFSGEESIDQLANGIQSMIDSLNELVSQVQQSGIQVTSSATEIAATARQQEATVTEQAASTNQIMATATQISATTRELASTMHEVADVADKTAVSANDGQDALTNMENTMMQMSNATASITSKLAVLSEKAANINTVVTTITKVADQTNLLSLNAAIEAEKAGEYGLGFAVVATEIRRLADQTAVATWDIEQMVKEMQSAVSAGVMGMDKFSEEVTRGVDEVRQIGGQLAHIIEQVQTLTPRFESVNEGMQSQSQGAQQISEGMVQLNDATQQTVESLRQSTLTINSLKDAAQDLQNGVSRFRVKQ